MAYNNPSLSITVLNMNSLAHELKDRCCQNG